MKGLFRAVFGPSHSLDNPNAWFLREMGLASGKKSFSTDTGRAFQLSAVFACQRAISESLAILPRYFVEKENDDERVVITDHPSLPIFQRAANDLMSSYTFVETLTNHALGWGNGYAELQMEKGGTRILKAWPLPPDRVRPIKVTQDDGQIFVRYEVTLPDGATILLPQNRILHVMGISYDGLCGQSIIKAACNAIGLGEDLEEFARQYFNNGVLGGGFITVPAGMEKDAIRNLRTDLDEMNSGLENAHRFKFLYDSVTYSASQVKPEEAQFIQSRVNQIQEIARFYRMPLYKIQEYTKVSYNSAEQLATEFVGDTLMPWGTRWEQEIDRKFFTDPKDSKLRMKFNYNALLRGDSQARANYYRTMVMSGIMTRNEARRLEDLPRMEGGDELMTPMNMTDAAQQGTGSEKQDAARERIQD